MNRWSIIISIGTLEMLEELVRIVVRIIYWDGLLC